MAPTGRCPPHAIADRDPLRAVIRGGALNNDGAGKVGFTAPGVDGQAEVIATSLELAGWNPEEYPEV